MESAMDAPLRERRVVTAFLTHEGRVLVLRRSGLVGTYRGHWAGVSGSIEAGRTPGEQALAEIAEETSLGADDVTMLAAGEPLRVEDPALGSAWVVHPFLFRVADPMRVRLDWEHVESKWVLPDEVGSRDTVPGLSEALQRVWS
jgi:8-oxo-dGTP diphosphatase